jgi:hypothetical protein
MDGVAWNAPDGAFAQDGFYEPHYVDLLEGESNFEVSVVTPKGELEMQFTLPQDAGVYSFQALMSSSILCPGRCYGDGDASAPAIALSLTGTVDLTASQYGSCDSSIGCQYDYAANLSLVDTAHGVSALNLTLSAWNSESPLQCTNASGFIQ